MLFQYLGAEATYSPSNNP